MKNIKSFTRIGIGLILLLLMNIGHVKACTPPTTPTITGATSFCTGGGGVTLTSSSPTGTISYQWNKTGVGAISGATSSTYLAPAAGTYTVTVTVSGGCNATSTGTAVTVNSPPGRPTITGATSFCSGGAGVTLTSSSPIGTTGFQWYIGGVLISGATSSTYLAAAAGTYTVIVTNAGGCASLASLGKTVTVNSNTTIPTIIADGPTTFCSGSSVILTANAFPGFLWSTGATTAAITVYTSGVYSVTETDAHGCASPSSASVSVTVNISPTPTITASRSAICDGQQSSVLDGGVYTSYEWNDDNNSTTESITVTDNEIYDVTVTDANGCTASAYYEVTVNPLPTPSISASNASICAGQGSSVLDADLYSSYLWNDPSGSTSETITVGDGNTYSVRVTDENGCYASASYAVSINSLPTPSITASNASICAGQGSSILDAGSYSTYAWNDPSSSTSESITVNDGNSYSVTVTDDNGCTASSSYAVSINPLPKPSISGGGIYCASSTPVTLDAGSYAYYVWNDNSTNETLSASTSGNYSVTVTDNHGCSGSASASLTINTKPTPSISGGGTYCARSTPVSLDAGAGYATYAWSTSANTEAISASSTGTYSVTVTDGNGCSGSGSASLTINANPTPSINGGGTYCASSTPVSLDAGAGYATYAWSTSANTEAISASSTGTYSVTVTDGNGCSGSASVSLTINTNPTPSISGGGTYCASSTPVSLDAGSYTSYVWNDNSTNETLSPSASGNYSVTVTDNHGCSGSASASLIINTNPTPSISGGGTYCASSTPVSLDAGSYISYVWNDNSTNETLSASASGNYSVTVTDNHGCSGSASTPLTINTNPTPSISGGGTYCASSTPVSLDAGSYTSYVWNDNSTNETLSASASGNYSVIVTDNNGCSGSASASLTINLPPAANAGSNGEIVNGSSVSIGGSAVSGSTYSWTSSPSGFSCTSANPSVHPSVTTTYTLTETNSNGCVASHSVTVTVDPLTSTITPGSTTTFCSGGSVVLTAGTNASNVTYQWSNGSGSISGATSSTYTTTASGNYYVTVTNGTASTTSSATAVTVHQLPTATISGSTAICLGSAAPTMGVSVGNTDGANWSLVYSDGTSMHTLTGSGDASATFAGSNSATTTYSLISLTETSGNGCSSSPSGSATVIVNSLPSANAGNNATIAFGSSVQIGAGAVTGSTYLWTPSTGLDNASSANPNATPASTTTYTVTEQNANGCSASHTVTVTVVYPAIDVTGNSNNITAGSTTVATTNATDFGTTITGTSSETYTVQNNGGAPLNISNVSIGGTNASDFTVTTSPASSVSSNGSTSFVVTFNSATAGTYTGTVTVSSNDPNTPSYTYAIQATAAYPAISITGNSNNITAGSTTVATTNATDFGTTITGTSSETYKVQNNGGAPLNISNVSIGGMNASDFTVTTSPASSVSSNGSTSFVVTFNSATAGTYTGTVTVSSNDPNTPSYTYAIQAAAADPAINITGNSNNITAGSTTPATTNATDFGTTITGTSSETYTVQNNGGAPLSISNVSIGGTNASDFTVTTSPASSVSANSSTTFIVTFNASATGTYTGTVTVASNDPNTPSYTYTIQAAELSAPVVTGSNSFCSGSSTVLTASSEPNYQWNDANGPISGATSSTYTANYGSTFYVTTSLGSSSVKSNNIVVTMNPLPTANISGGTGVCYGMTAPTLYIGVANTGGANWSLVYSDGTSNHTITGTGNTTVNITGSNTTTTTYSLASLTETSGNGCSSSPSGSTIVTVNALPSANAGSNAEIVNGSSVSIGGSAVSGSTYSWTSSPSGFSCTSANPSVHPSVTTTYTLTETNSNGCVASHSVTVTVDPLTSTITPGSTTTFCSGGSVALTAGTNASNVTYQWSNGSGSISGATSSSYIASASGNYYVTVTNGTASTTSSATAVTVHQLPTATISGSTAICLGSTAPAMSVSVGNTDGADWSLVYNDGSANHTLTGTGNSTATFTGSNSASTTYSLVSVNETSGNGCSTNLSGSTSVTVNALPAANAGSSTTILQGSSTTLGGAAVGGSSYVWTPATGLSSASVSNPTATPTATTTYTVCETNANGCKATHTVTVTVTPLTITASGNPTTFCAGNTGTLTANTNATHIQWYNASGAITGATSSTYTTGVAGTYYAVATNGNASATSSNIAVTVNPLPTATISGGTSVCNGSTAPVISVAVANTGGANWSLVYSDGTSNHTLTGSGDASATFTGSNTATTTYSLVSVNETSGNGCSNTLSGSATVTVNALPAANAGSNATILQGSSTTLGGAAVGGSSYVWTPATGLSSASVSNPTATPSVTTTYTKTETNSNGCVNSHTVTVSVTPLTISVSGNPTAFCAGGSGTLTANTNASGIQWYNGNGAISGATSSTYTATAAGTYYAIATNGNASATSSNITVTVNPLPTATISGGTSVCNGSTAPVISVAVANTGGANWSLVYSDGTSNHTLTGSGDTSPTFSGSNSASTTYSLVSINETSGNGCSTNLSGSTSVAVNALPAANAGSNATILQGSSVKIGGAGVTGSTYSWSPSTGLTSSTTADPTATPSTTTTYTKTEKNANGCTASHTVTVSVTPLTISVSGNPTTFCAGGSGTLTANTNASGIQWYNGNGAIGGATSSTYTATAAGTYYAVVTNGNASAPSSNITVTVNPLPTATISGGTSVCSGSTAPVISVAVANTGGANWSLVYSDGTSNHTLTGTGNSTATFTGSNSASTTYSLVSVNETSGNGCSTTLSGSTSVAVNALPAANAGSNATILQGSSVKIGGAGVTGSTYSWSPSTGLSSSTTADPTATPSVTTTYTKTETNSNGCVNSHTVTVSVTPLTISVSGNPTTFCAGGSGTLTANTNASNIQWYNGSGAITGATSSTYTATAAGTYYAIAGNGSASTTSSNIAVTVNPLPTAIISGGTSVCNGSTAPVISVAVANTGGANWSLVYSDGTSMHTITGTGNSTATFTGSNTATTTYSLVSINETSGNGCSTNLSGSTSVTVNALPAANAGSSTTILQGSSAAIGGTAVTGSTYSWSPSTGLSNASAANPTATPSSTTTYTVTEKNASGCTASHTVTVTVTPLSPSISANGNTSFCDGDSVLLTSTSGPNYQWNDVNGPIAGANSQSFYADYTSTFYITMTNGNASATTNSIKVTVNPTPDANAGTASVICTGYSAAIGSTAVNGNTYSWSSSPTDNNLQSSVANQSVSPSQSTTYTLLEVTPSGCSNSNSVIVTVNPAPAADGGNNVTILSGSSANIGINAVGDDTYSWLPAGSLDNASGSNPVATPASTTTYTVTETNDNGCSASDIVTVTVTPITSSVSANGNPTSFCPGGSVALSATSNASNLQWYNASGAISGETNTTYTASAAGSYYVIASNGSVNQKSNSINVTVNSLPVANAGKDVSVCSGTAASIGTAAVSGNTYSWLSIPSGYSSTSAVNSVSPSITTDYVVTATNISGCFSNDTVVVTVNPLPAGDAGTSQTINSGSSTSIGGTAVTGSTYAWTSSPSGFTSTSSNPTVTPSVNTTYTVTETNASGCKTTNTVTITVTTSTTKPTICITGQTTFCAGGSVKLTSSTAYSYQWSNASGNISGATSQTYYATTSGTYYVTVVAKKGGTSATSNGVAVTVIAAPAAYTGSNVSICAGNSVTLGTTAVTGNTYGWTVSGSGSCGGSSRFSTSSKITVTPNATTTYTLTETNKNGCSASNSVTVTVVAKPYVTLSCYAPVCANSNAFALTGGSPSGGVYTVDGVTATSFNPSAMSTGTHTITYTYTNSTGCSSSAKSTITVSPAVAQPTISYTGSLTICSGNSVKLTANISGNYGCGTTIKYQWSNQNGPLMGSGSTSQSYSASVSGTYYVTVNVNGCSNTSKGVTVIVNATPKATTCGDQTYNYGYDNDPVISCSSDQTNCSFKWSCGSSSSKCTVNPSQTTKYTCTVTANGCASAPASCSVNVHDCRDNNYCDKNYNSKCSMCYYDSHKKQWCQVYVNKCDVSSYERNGYKFDDCGHGANLSAVSSDDINVYPNPFTSSTNIRVNFVQDEQVKVDVVSMEGKVVISIFDGAVQSGMPYNFTFDGTPFQSGIYMVRVISGNTVQIRKIDLLKN